MVKDSPLKNSKNQRSIRAKSVILNEQLQCLYQIEQRKCFKLENENRALRERINNLLTKEDDERIELLAADKTRRKLAQIKAITERTIRSLETGITEFRAFVGDIDEALLEEEYVSGAIEPAKANQIAVSMEGPSREYKPTLKRIPESPMVPMASTSSSSSTFRFSNEYSIVDESNIFDESQPQQQLGDGLGLVKETGMDKIEEEEEANSEQAKVENEKIDEPLKLNEEEGKVEMNGKEEEMEKMEEANEEEKFESADEETKTNIPDEKTAVEQEHHVQNHQNMSSPKLSIVNETIWTTARMEEEEDEEEETGNVTYVKNEWEDAEEGKENNQNEEEAITPVLPSTITIRRTTMRRTPQNQQNDVKVEEEKDEVSVVAETPADNNDETDENENVDEDLTLTKMETVSQYSGTSTPFSTPHSCNTSSTASGRQRRAAATKIGNYKEPSLNKKMRRE